MRSVLGTTAVGLVLAGCTAPPGNATSDSTETSTSSSSTTVPVDATSSTTGTTAEPTSATTLEATTSTSGSSSGPGSTMTGSSTSDASSSSDSGGTSGASSSSDSGSTSDASTSASGSGSTSDASTATTATTGVVLHPLRVFITSQTHNGAYGGTAGADTLCNDLATAAGLGGTFTAWLSTSTEDAASRIDPTGVPYILVDGTIVASGLVDLLDGSLDTPINVDETGTMTFGDVWTGTLADGTAAPVHCFDWTEGASPITGRCGSSATTTSAWTDNITPTCGAGLRLYCFEQG